MKRISFFTVVLLAFAIVCNAEGLQWKQDAIECVHTGMFAKADSILASMDEKESDKYAFEIDSIRQIMQRIRNDFNVTPEEGYEEISRRVANLTPGMVEDWKQRKCIETMNIDGKEWWFRKAVRNLWLLDYENFGMQNEADRKKEYNELYKYYIESMSSRPDERNIRNWHKAEIVYTLDVDADAVPDGEKIRVWLPFPFENDRQRNIKLLGSSHKVKKSKGSKHHTVSMEAVAEAGKPTHFEITYEYEVGAQSYSADVIAQMIEPYDKGRKEYKKYTGSEYPHIICNERMRHIADSITAAGGTPLEQASVVYDWIVDNFPWAGARDYSTIPNIPEYVLEQGHGDCGQVTLLYITLLRSIGIPARWESGWMLHPGRVGMHDWCEVYFEGVGWVPCDVSMGSTVRNEVIGDYYKTGIDVYRLATNECNNGTLNPKKRYLRTETVDFQEGEVEWKGGNVPHSAWTSNLKVNKFKRVGTYNNKR